MLYNVKYKDIYRYTVDITNKKIQGMSVKRCVMNKERERKVKIRYSRVGAVVIPLLLVSVGIMAYIKSHEKMIPEMENDASAVSEYTDSVVPAEAVAEPLTEAENGNKTVPFVVYPKRTDASVKLDKKYDGKNVVLYDAETGEVVAYRDENVRIYPASLTKVMTLIVAVENIKDLSDKVEITEEMVNPMIALDASRAGFAVGEKPSLDQVLYGMVLESGADAALAAAVYVAGSEEAFVELMNRKAEDMKLKDTHFTNVVGLHAEDHYSTAADMAAILDYAMQDETCLKYLTAVEYKYPPTKESPEGLTFNSTLFSRMFGDEMPNVTVKGGKTGYTDEAKNCVETFADVNGKKYILVIAGDKTNWNAIYDTLSIYSTYCAGGKDYEPPKK